MLRRMITKSNIKNNVIASVLVRITRFGFAVRIVGHTEMCSTANFKQSRVSIGIRIVPFDKLMEDSACRSCIRCLCQRYVSYAVGISNIKNALQIKSDKGIIIPKVANADFLCHRIARDEGLIVSAEISKHLNGILWGSIGK